MAIHDAGLDWLTMTFDKSEPNHEKYVSELQNLLVYLGLQGFDQKRAAWQGYAGMQSGKIFLGFREDGAVLRASGNHAKIAEQFIRERNIEGKPTRCDFQITRDTGTASADFGARVREEVESFTRTNARAARRSLACYKNLGRDSGLAIGSRSSQRYARIYNKTLEQRGRIAPNLWRYEVEFKGGQARQIWNMNRAATRSYWLAQSIVKTEFEQYGCDMEFVTNGEKYERASTYEATSVERKLNWFRSHVRSSVRELIEAGYEAAVLDALGIDINS